MSYNPPLYKKIFHASRRLLATRWLARMGAVQIAVTGSQGKTTLRTVLFHLLSQLGNTTVTDLNLDSNFSVPMTALSVKPSTRFAIFECGIDHKGEMDRHLEIITPHIAIITGVSPVHTDAEHLGSFENLIAEKQKLIEKLGKDDFAILNYDDINVRKMARYTKARVIFYGTDKAQCDVSAHSAILTTTGLTFDMTYGGKTLRVASRLIGMHHIYTFMSAFCVYRLIAEEKKLDAFPSLIADITPLHGRMSIEQGPQGTVILNDSLRANPTSTASGLHSFSAIQIATGKKIAILGEMGELARPEEEHKKIGKLISTLPIDYVFGIGPLQKIVIDEAVANGFPKDRAFAVSDIHQAVGILTTFLKSGDFLYIKGSLMRHMERIIMLLEKQEVGCTVVVCPFYHPCQECEYKVKGYQNRAEKN